MARELTRRKLLALGSGLLLVGPALVACGGGAPASPTAGSQAAPTQPASGGQASATQPTAGGQAAATQPAGAVPAATKEGAISAPKAAGSIGKPGAVTIRFMKFAGPGWAHDETFTKRFMEANPNIEVKIEDVIYGEMYKKSLALGATNTLADVFAGHNRWTPYQAFKGLCLDLDPLVKTHKDELQFDDFFPSVLEDARGLGADGKLFWLPTVVHPAGNAVVAFNKELLDKAGVKAPASKDWTIEQLEQIVRKAADPKAGIYGFDMNLSSPLYAAQALRSWSSNPTKSTDDSWLVSRDGKKQQLDSPPVKQGYEWYWKMIKDGLVPNTADKNQLASSGINFFITGKIVAQAAELLSPTTWLEKIQGKFETVQALWPKGPHGHRGSALSYNNQMIFAKTKYQEESLKLLNILTGPDIAFLRGYEGVGQAGARRTAWFNPKLWEKFPITKDGAQWFEEGVDPYPRPWNLRAQEHQEVYAQEIQAYLDGKEDWNQMFAHVQPRGQEIIDLPRP